MKNKETAFGVILLGVISIAYVGAKQYPEKEKAIMNSLAITGGLVIGYIGASFIIGKYQLK